MWTAADRARMAAIEKKSSNAVIPTCRHASIRNPTAQGHDAVRPVAITARRIVDMWTRPDVHMSSSIGVGGTSSVRC